MARHLIGSMIILLLLSGSTCLIPPCANILHSPAYSSSDRTRKQLLLLPQGPSPIHCSQYHRYQTAHCSFTSVDRNNLRPAGRPHCHIVALIILVQLTTSPPHQVLGCYNSAQSQLN